MHLLKNFLLYEESVVEKMAYERHVQCLKVIALMQIFFDRMTQATLPKGLKCPFLKASIDADWNKFGGHQWMEGLQYPNMWNVCHVLEYFPSNNTFTIKTRPGPTGPAKVLDSFKLRKEDDRRYLADDSLHVLKDKKFYQILDTDYASWALIHHCWENTSGSWFVVALTKPMAEVPANVMKKVQDAMAQSGETRNVTWNRSACMLKKVTIGADVVSAKLAPADTLSLVVATEPVDKLSLVDGEKAPVDKPSLVDG